MSRAPLPEADADALIKAALDARSRSYAPYSRFRVGAALLAEDGEVIAGCNVENASYGLCICAERSAVGAAVSGGRRRFKGIAIATGSSPPSTPCGMCRQTLAEFADELPIMLVNDQGERTDVWLSELFPGSFNLSLLRDGADPEEEAE
jgi:cytidine deaminase